MNGPFEKLARIRKELPDNPESGAVRDEFLSEEDLVPIKRQTAENRLKSALAELEELQRENRWQEIIDLFAPVEDKLPELIDLGLEVLVREKIAFAQGQIGRFDDAIAELLCCLERSPDRFSVHNSLAYNAYNSLFAAKNREILLSGKARQERIILAHRHFQKARAFRPDGVTNFYREGMLFHRIEEKPEKALSLFDQAVANWDKLDKSEKERRHQERKNFVKALYRQAAALLAVGRFKAARASLKRCLLEDETSGHLLMLHKYFALGKIEFHLNWFKEARNALLFAEKCRRHRDPVDFVYELLARVYLALENPCRALEILEKVPEKHRRPYYRWTEADVLCSLKRYDQAKAVLLACTERDHRSRHKGLLKLCKIEYLLGNFSKGAAFACEADRFFRQKWGNAYGNGLFWQALSRFRMGETEKAKKLAMELRDHFPRYPKLNRLFALMERNDDTGEHKNRSPAF